MTPSAVRLGEGFLLMTRSIFKLSTALVAVSLFGFGSAAIAQTASIKGKFVFDGDPPKRAPLTCGPNGQINKDVATCCQVMHFDDTLVVNKNGEIANIIVWVRTTGLKVPTEMAAAHKEPVLLDNKNCKFEPRVVCLVKGQKLIIGNSDNVGHNSNVTALQFNPIVAAGQQVEFEPKTVRPIPTQVTCNIHPWMSGWVVVRPDPFFAVSAEDGTFEIKGLPAGKALEFQVWQEKSGFVTDIKLNNKATTWGRGRFEQKLKAGENDLGDIKVAKKNFDK
jgi:hypothetical protein